MYVLNVLYVCMCLSVRLSICPYLSVCLSACMHACMYACLCVSVCVYHLNRCKTSLFFFLLSSPFLILILMQGSGEQWWSHHSTKTLHHLLWYDEGTPLSRTCLFSSNLHVTGFSSCRITIMIHSYLVWFLWWLRHGAMGPIEATLFGVNVDWIDFRINTF